MKFGIIGCGNISKKHIFALNKLRDADVYVSAVCDSSSERAEAAAELSGGQKFENYREMLDKADIDIVSILSPSGLHTEHALASLQAGKDVVIEKPLALNFDDGERIVRLADEVGRRVFVVKQNRFNPPVRLARTELEAGNFGRLVLGTVRMRWRRLQDYYDSDSWRGTWAHDGGVLANQAAHHIDLLQWFFGEVESVHCRTATQLVDIEVEDTAVATLKFTNGALGIIEATTATRPKDLEGSLSILGERGTVVIGGFAANEAEVWKFAGRDDDAEARTLAELAETPANFVSPHYQFLNEVIASVRENRRALVDGLEGMKNLRLVHALYESAHTGREVAVSFRPRHSRLGESIADS